MPYDYGSFMGSMADAVSRGTIENIQNRQQQQNRNALLQNDRDQVDLVRQRFEYGKQQDAQTAQQDAEEEAAWNAAIDAEDYQTALRIDPHSTKLFIEGRKLLEPEKAPSPIEYQKTPWGGYLGMQDGKKIESWNPPSPQQIAPSEAEKRWRFRQSLPPDQRAEFDKGDSSNARKPLPVGALRIVDEAKQAQAAAKDSKTLVDSAVSTLTSGKVKLGAAENVKSRGKNWAGYSDTNSRAYADIQQTLEKLRNNYLLLAKGVQTEGDAQRAWNSEIGESVQNDNELAKQQLQKAQGMIDRAIEAQQARIDNVYSNYGAEPADDGASPLSPAEKAELESLRQKYGRK